jgi:hypothetical protein
MELNGLLPAMATVFGIFLLIGVANLVDYSFQTMAENRAARAERARFLKWGLPAPARPEHPRNDDHLWHF